MVRKAKPKADSANPEQLPSKPENSLFGSKKEAEDQEAAAPARGEDKKSKRPRPEVLKEDPVAASLRAAKKQKKEEAREAKEARGRGGQRCRFGVAVANF